MASPNTEAPDPPLGWKAVWAINAAALRACASFGLAWLFWDYRSVVGLEVCVVLVPLFAVVGVKHSVIALAHLIRFILRQRAWARYRRQGTAPKADPIAGEAALKRRGLLR